MAEVASDVTYSPLTGGGFPQRKHHQEDYSDLVQALKEEERAANNYLQSELSVAQIDALRRYYGELYGDEEEGRSQVVTREVFETIEWLRPGLRRVFTAGGKIVEFEAQRPEDEQYVNAATEYVNYVFFQDNKGAKVLKDFIFDGLLQRVGFIAAEWKDAEYSAPQETSGLGSMKVAELLQDPWTEIIEQEVTQGPPDEAHPDGYYFSLKIRRKTKDATADVFCIAPEDMLISARAVDLETARYAGDRIRMQKGKAKRKWPEFAGEIEGYTGTGATSNTWMSDDRRAERFRDLEGIDIAYYGRDEATEIEILREYIDFDKDGDGYPEKLRIYRLGDIILECEEVDEHIYSYWTAVDIPHKMIGLGIADTASDLQRVKTVLLRSVLDSVYQSVAPRMGADENRINLDDLLTVRAGAVIRSDGNPNETLSPIVVPDLSQTGIVAMQWIDQVLEARTGVTKFARGLDPDILNKTATAAQLMNNAAGEREEEYADNIKDGLTCFFRKLYRLICSHQNEARQVKIAKEWKNVDPRSWSADLKCKVNTGLGTGAIEQLLMRLGVIQADQVAWVGAYGPSTPAVTPQHLRATVAEKCRILDQDPDKYFGQIPPGWAPQPPPDPAQQKAQAEIEEKKVRLQMDGATAQHDAKLKELQAQADVQLTKEKTAADLQGMREKAALEIQLRREIAEAEMAMAAAKADAEAELARAKAQFEAELAEQKMKAEIRLAEEKQAAEERLEQRRISAEKSNGIDSDPNFGGKVG